MILAPGGGWITIPGVLELLRPAGAVVYLAARPATALRRMGPLLARRPILAAADPLVTLTRLHEERAPLYEAAADRVIDTEQLDLKGVAAAVVEWISLFRGNPVMPGGKDGRS
jgi:shikimate kinase